MTSTMKYANSINRRLFTLQLVMFFIIFLCMVLPDIIKYKAIALYLIFKRAFLLFRKKVIITKNMALPQKLLTFCSFKPLKYACVTDNFLVGSYSTIFYELFYISLSMSSTMWFSAQPWTQ
jgi:hypothetical protein